MSVQGGLLEPKRTSIPPTRHRRGDFRILVPFPILVDRGQAVRTPMVVGGAKVCFVGIVVRGVKVSCMEHLNT